MALIYHIAFDADWDITKQNGFYEHPSLKEEGFIHCSQEHQLSEYWSVILPAQKIL
jgi:uncharacterized protein (DUF952 family)